jgi:hypothetical protein
VGEKREKEKGRHRRKRERETDRKSIETSNRMHWVYMSGEDSILKGNDTTEQ